jgi:hypothetical protein
MTVHPTVAEQLAGIRRVLHEVVAPAVSGAYPAEMLRWSAEALGRLSRQDGLAETNLSWEAAATAALLARIAALPGYERAPHADVDPAAGERLSAAAGLADLQAQALAARGRLAAVIRAAAFQPGAEALTRELMAHMRASAARAR